MCSFCLSTYRKSFLNFHQKENARVASETTTEISSTLTNNVVRVEETSVVVSAFLTH